MTTKLLIGFLAIPAIFLGLLASADYAVIDVRQGGPDGMRIIVPVPVSLARLALNFAPAEAKYIEVPEIGQYLPYAERIVEELRGIPDGLLVEIEERHTHVIIEKVGENLDIHVEDGSDIVDVTVPLNAVLDVLKAYDGTGFDTRDVLRAVRHLRGDVVHVRSDEEEVRIWVW